MIKDYIKEFGIKTFVVTGFTRVLRKLKLKNMVTMYEKFKYDFIINWLDKEYGQEADRMIEEYPKHNKIEKNAPIWIFWWQGKETMPPIVKVCYNSVLQNAANHEVILITENNIKEYIDIPQYIYDKINEKKMTLTHFSDVLRENLLFKYGGIWMDATIYMTAPFAEEIYNYEYFSIKGAFEEWEWTGFFQASGKDNIFAKTVSHLFDCYWKEHECLISYLLIDCFLAVARKHSKDINEMIDKLPKGDNSVFLLNDVYLDKVYSENDLKQIYERTNIHKLSYKYPHDKIVQGKKTVWGMLLDENTSI